MLPSTIETEDDYMFKRLFFCIKLQTLHTDELMFMKHIFVI